MPRFYVSDYAFKHYDFRPEHHQKEVTEGMAYKLISSKYRLAFHKLASADFSHVVTVHELRNKRAGIYGYTFHCIIALDLPGEPTRYFYSDGGYRPQAFIGAAHHAGLQYYSTTNTRDRLAPCSGIVDADGRTLPPLFAALCPGAELDLDNSYTRECLNY